MRGNLFPGRRLPPALQEQKGPSYLQQPRCTYNTYIFIGNQVTESLGTLGKGRRRRKCVYTEAFLFTRMPEVPTRTSGHAYVGQGGLGDAVSMHRRPRTGGLREGKDPETGPGQRAQWLECSIPGHWVAGLIPSLWSGCPREATTRCLSPSLLKKKKSMENILR